MAFCEILWNNIKLIINIDKFNNKFFINFIILKYDFYLEVWYKKININ